MTCEKGRWLTALAYLRRGGVQLVADNGRQEARAPDLIPPAQLFAFVELVA